LFEEPEQWTAVMIAGEPEESTHEEAYVGQELAKALQVESSKVTVTVHHK
jgi:hypothetical protein